MEEAAIIKRAQEGDIGAFSELVTLYKKLIYNLCLRMLGDRDEAEDAAQETFIRIYRSLKTYNWESKFSTWAMKIASNLSIDFIRKRKAQMVPIDDYDFTDGSTPENTYIASETRKDIKKAVQGLPEKYRMIIIYYHFMNLSYQEISDILNEPMSIVKNRLYRARRMLRESMNEREGNSSGVWDIVRTDNEIS